MSRGVKNNRNLCIKPSSFTYNKSTLFSLYIKTIYPLNTSMYSVLYMIVSNIAIVCCCIPFVLLASRKMRQVTTYRLLGIYWLLNGFIHFADIYFFRSYKNGWLDKLTEYYNVLDTPLVLLIFFNAAAGPHRRLLLRTLLAFVLLEALMLGWKGYAFTSGFVFVGSGVLLVLVYSIIGLVQYMRKMEYTPFETSMVFVYFALLFGYGSYLIIYMFVHFRGDSEVNSQDSALLYYVMLLLSAIITSLGLWGYGIRRPPVAAA